jgi:hypothetical protein
MSAKPTTTEPLLPERLYGSLGPTSMWPSMSPARPATNYEPHKKTPSKEGVGKLPVTGEEEKIRASATRGRDLLRVDSLSGNEQVGA